MNRKMGAALLLALLLCAAGAEALAVKTETWGRLWPIAAEANQKLALRTGPGTKYEEVFTVTRGQIENLSVMEQEKGGSVMWGMVEFDSAYGRYRAYTGMKRIDAKEVPIREREGTEARVGGEDVYAYHGPGRAYARFEEKIPAETFLLIFHEEAGYVLADYVMPDAKPQQRDKELLQVTRGWIPAYAVSGYEARTTAIETDK